MINAMEQNKSGQGEQNIGEIFLDKMVREGLAKKATFELSSKKNEGSKFVNITIKLLLRKWICVAGSELHKMH